MTKLMKCLLAVFVSIMFLLGSGFPVTVMATEDSEDTPETPDTQETTEESEPQETEQEPIETSETEEDPEVTGEGENTEPAEETEENKETPGETEQPEESLTPEEAEPAETGETVPEEPAETPENTDNTEINTAEEEDDEGASVMAVSGPYTLDDWVIDGYGYGGSQYNIPNNIILSSDGDSVIFEVAIHPERTDYYTVSTTNINHYYSYSDRTSYWPADSMKTVITDSDGNELFSYEQVVGGGSSSGVPQNEFVMEKGKTYTMTVTYNNVHENYRNKAPAGNNAGYIYISHVHHYENGRCICYDEYPDDTSSHVTFYLAGGYNNKPDYVYVAKESDKTTRIIAHATVSTEGYSFNTTTDHLNGSIPYLGGQLSFFDYNSPPYWDVTVWTDDPGYYPVTFRLTVNESNYSLNEPEIISGKGQVKIGVGPSGNGLNWGTYSYDDISQYPILQWNTENDELMIGWQGYDDDGSYHWGSAYYGDYVYKPLSFKHFDWDSEPGKILVRQYNYSENSYAYEDISNGYYSTQIPYVLSIILEKKPPVPGPVVEQFDVEMSDVTDDSATITITGKLDRDLYDLQGNEEPYYQKLKESIMLSVGTTKTVIGPEDVDEEGNFTITLENAPLDANIVLTTRDDTRSNVYEQIPVPLLQIPVKKIWTDAEGNISDEITARHKDDEVTVTVYANGEETDRKKVLNAKSEDPWEDVIKGLPEYTHYENGSEPEKITYTVKETEVKGYKAQYGDEESSKYLELGDEVTDAIFSGKYILLSESAKMALTVEGDKVTVKPFDPDDEYQKWSTEGHTFDNAFVWNGYGDPLGSFDAVIIRNDKTGKYLAINFSGPFLVDDPDHDNIATYVQSSVTGHSVIRTASLANRPQNRMTNYADFMLEYYAQNLGIDPETVIKVDPAAVFPIYGQFGQRLIAPPWPYIALRWYDAGMSQAYVTSLASSVLADVNVFDESNGILYKVTNTPRTLMIEKKITNAENGSEYTVDDETFYFALFTDEARTKRVEGIDVQKLTIKNGSSNKIIIEGLANGTYYIGETDRSGKLLESGKLSTGDLFTPDYGNGYSFEVTDDSEGIELTVTNVVKEPEPTGEIKVTKKLVDDATGAAVTAKGKYTVYVALFSDKECTVRVSGIQKITINGNSSSSTTFKDLPAGTYYVAETDANGTKLSHGALSDAVGFKVEYSGNKVTVKTNGKASAEIKNVFTTTKKEPPTKTNPPTVPNTGDQNHINLWILMLMISTGAAINIFRMLKRSSKV